MDLEMAGGMKGYDRCAASIGPDAERDLLGHGATRQEQCRFLTKQRRDLALQVRDDATFTVAVGLLRASFAGEVGKHSVRTLRAMAEQEAFTLREQLLRHLDIDSLHRRARACSQRGLRHHKASMRLEGSSAERTMPESSSRWSHSSRTDRFGSALQAADQASDHPPGANGPPPAALT